MNMEQSQEEYLDGITIEDSELNIEQAETVEYIEVEPVEEYVIEIEENVGSDSSGVEAPTHYDLPDRNDKDQHIIGAITGLEDILKKLSFTKDNYSTYGGYAEFRPWLKDGYYYETIRPNKPDGVGYFVSLVTDATNNVYIDVCQKVGDEDITDMYGVTVANSSFCGYQSNNYSCLKGDLSSCSDSVDLSDDPDHAKVCLLGNVKVRIAPNEWEDIHKGDYVVPKEDGYATTSKNNIGFRVISKGTIGTVGSEDTAWFYVEIALIPQNDRINKELKNIGVSLNNVTLELGDMSTTIGGISNITTEVSNRVNGFENILSETEIKVNQSLETAQDSLEKAEKIAEEAQTTIETVGLEYSDAVSKANEAKLAVDDALATVNQMKQELNPLAQWQEDGTSNIAGFVARANADSVTLGTITQAYGTDLSGIIQKIDENGAVIQHLVTHVDKYTLGKSSPADRLSPDELGILQPGIIYVPTDTHDETSYIKDGQPPMTFSLGNSYVFRANDLGEYVWAEDRQVSTSTSEFNGEEEGDLWYCWQGILNGNKYIYNPGTLYRWDATGSGLWVAVASVNDKAARAVGLINQTAQKLTIAYENLNGDVANLNVKADGISSTVESVKGDLSQINQTAEEIMMGIYDSDEGATSLSLLLEGMTSSSINTESIMIKHVLSENPTPGDKYTNPPIWDGEKFVFAEGDKDTSGKYYFDSDVHTYYCENVSDGYKVWGIGNIAMNSLKTRVTDAESEIESWTRFKSEMNETATSVSQTSTETEAEIFSMVFGEYRKRTEINLELTEDDINSLPTTRYPKPPKYTNGAFTFEGIDEAIEDKDKIYCMDTDTSCYYKLLLDDDNKVIGYEKYKMKDSNYASIVQKSDEDGSSVGLVAGNDDAIGSLFVNAINDKSEVLINADKILMYSAVEKGFPYLKWYIGDEDVEAADNVRANLIFKPSVYPEGFAVKQHEYMKIGYRAKTTNTTVQADVMFGESRIWPCRFSVTPDDTWHDIVINLSTVPWSGGNGSVMGSTSAERWASVSNTYISGLLLRPFGTTGLLKAGSEFNIRYVAFFDNKEEADAYEFNYDTPSGVGFVLFDGYSVVTEKVESSDQITNGTNGIRFSRLWEDGIEGTVKSALSIEAGKIAQIVSAVGTNGEVTSASIATAINESESSVLINADKIRINGTAVFADILNDGSTTISGKYIRTGTIQSNKYKAPITPEGFAQEGMEINLDNGTIFSKNFLLDANGDVSIRGWVKADSGYIGGFTIEDDKLYNDQHALVPTEEMGELFKKKGTCGVFISPSGIGLGNGNFYVNSEGNVTTFGNVSMCAIDDNGAPYPLLTIQKGSLSISGSIDWSLAEDPPVFALYHASNKVDGVETTPDKPNMNYVSYKNATKGWHQKCSNSDVYVVYNYNSGKSDGWEEVLKIANVPDYIHENYISQTQILSPNIYGGMFYATGQGAKSGPAYYIYNGVDVDNPNNPVLGDLKGYISYDEEGSGQTNEKKERVRFATTLNTALKISSGGNMSLSAGNQVVDTNTDDSGAGHTRYGGTIFFMSDVSFCPGSEINFNNAEVKNLSGVTAVFG